MYKILLIAIFTTLLTAQHPKPYASLSDPIYDNIKYIIKLRDMNVYQVYSKDINTYIEDVEQSKKNGFALERGLSSINKKKYLKKLRELSKTNVYFLENISNYYKTAMINNDFPVFIKIIDSGLIDVQKHKKEILNYYHKHQEKLKLSNTIKRLLNKETSLQAKKYRKKHYKVKLTKKEEKIKRIRERAKRKEKALEKKLQDELELKKLKIREEQKRELCN